MHLLEHVILNLRLVYQYLEWERCDLQLKVLIQDDELFYLLLLGHQKLVEKLLRVLNEDQ